MVGKSRNMSADMLLDLPTISAPSGEERTPRTSAQVERAGLCLRRFRGAQPGVRCVPQLKRRCLKPYLGLVSESGRLHSRSSILWAVPRTLYMYMHPRTAALPYTMWCVECMSVCHVQHFLLIPYGYL